MVGDVALGSDHPIRIQTMTTTDTKDVAATVKQVIVSCCFIFDDEDIFMFSKGM